MSPFAVAHVRFRFPLLRASATSRWPAQLKWTIVTGDGAAVRRTMRIREEVPSTGPCYWQWSVRRSNSWRRYSRAPSLCSWSNCVLASAVSMIVVTNRSRLRNGSQTNADQSEHFRFHSRNSRRKILHKLRNSELRDYEVREIQAIDCRITKSNI